jgi:hypothetical protein
MYYNINENQLVFTKTDKTSPDQFLRFTENCSITLQKIQIFEKKKQQKLKTSTDKPDKLSDK